MKKEKKTLAWIGGGILAGLIALGLASAKKPGIGVSIEYTKVEKI